MNFFKKKKNLTDLNSSVYILFQAKPAVYIAMYLLLTRNFITQFSVSMPPRKEPSHQSVVNCWQVLLMQTRQESRDHSFLSDSYSNTLPQQLSHCVEHAQRLAKRVHTITHTHHLAHTHTHFHILPHLQKQTPTHLKEQTCPRINMWLPLH